MINTALDWYKSIYRGEGLEVTREDLIEMVRQDYAATTNGQIQLSDDDAVAELGAQFMERAITDDAFIDKLVSEQPHIAQRIWQALKEWLSGFGKRKGDTATALELEQMALVKRAQKLYEKSFRQLQRTGMKDTVYAGEGWASYSLDVGGNDRNTVVSKLEANKDTINKHGIVSRVYGRFAGEKDIKQIRKAGEEEYNPADYMPTTEKSVDGMYEQLTEFIRHISNPYLKSLLEYFFVNDQEFIKKFRSHSAAKTVHHGFSGGLLEHTLSVLRMCEYFAGSYGILNKDLLLTAAMCHDIGKTRELSSFPDNDYTDEGQLIGHIVIGVEMLDEAIRTIPDFPVRLANELKHCIIAHHGELEYGSPKKPALAEAVALNLADNADAKMQTLTEIFKGKTGTDWLGFNRLFDSNLRRTSGA